MELKKSLSWAASVNMSFEGLSSESNLLSRPAFKFISFYAFCNLLYTPLPPIPQRWITYFGSRLEGHLLEGHGIFQA